MKRADDLVNAARRWTERHLPWFDVDRHERMAAKQGQTLNEADVARQIAERRLESYRHAHGIRRE